MNTIDGLKVKIKRMNRKTISMQITIDTESEPCLIVKVPRTLDEKYIKRVLSEKREWIDINMNRVVETQRTKTGRLSFFAIRDRGYLPLEGKKIPLHVVQDKNIPNFKMSIHRDRIVMNLNPFYTEKEEILETIRREYYNYALKTFYEMIRDYSSVYNFEVNKIRIKDMKTRWGSCSNKLNLNLNWRLILAEKQVYEYVLVHELCHLGCWNHSEAFWKRVEAILPDYKLRKTRLKSVSDFLSFFEFEKLRFELFEEAPYESPDC
ncbi:MAG TPA: SprT family zinc-dependent metalloprotease [Thermotogota bacterium]|nr:SprT family zinc-dependent metalloprotease [Thermotogota bacterium]HPR96145.1 SprT family zinc-dependent metalloprotease [Thermotogota bacterium]